MSSESKVYSTVRSDSVIDIAGVEPAEFNIISEDYITGKPKALQQDSKGYLIPDPALAYELYLARQESAKKPLALTRQTVQIVDNLISHQYANSLAGMHTETRYLLVEAPGGVGKSHGIEVICAKIGELVKIVTIEPDIDDANEQLLGKASIINPNEHNLIETTKALYSARGLKHPETVKFLKEHPKELYLALHPGPEGWFQKDPKSYCNFWNTVAKVEGIKTPYPTIPKMGIMELILRNGFVLFLDELNRVDKATRDLCMRVFEMDKNLEGPNGLIMLASEKRGKIIAAQNGKEEGYSTPVTDLAHSRRQKKPAIVRFNQNDYREYLHFLMTGESVENKSVKLKGETENKRALGAACTQDFIGLLSTANGKKVAQKDNALADIASMHMYMETQINEALKGAGWMEGEEIRTQEKITTGPTLLKAFVSRAYQLAAYEGEASCGLLEGIERVSRAFKEVYIEPLENIGVPLSKMASIVNFGTFGDQQAQGHQVAPNAVGHFASMFCPMRGVDLESLGDTGSLLNKFVEEGGVYAGLDGNKKPIMLECVKGKEKDKLKVIPYAGKIEFVLLPKARRDFNALDDIPVNWSDGMGFSEDGVSV